MPVYQRHDNPAPDSDYQPGELRHLVPGNTGRLLDARRTPISVVEVHEETGTFVVRIEDFEDKGEQWQIPFERVVCYQFANGGPVADAPTVKSFTEAVASFDRPLVIGCDPEATTASRRRLSRERDDARAWIQEHGSFVAARAPLPDPEDRRGDERLWRDLEGYLATRGVLEMDQAFARQYIVGPHSGEMIKGHAIVLAELGLAPFEGTIVRDQRTFQGAWSRAGRADHIFARMAFVQGLLLACGQERVTLFRGMSLDEPLAPPKNHTFVSASFSRAVAEAHFDAAPPPAGGVLYRQSVPVERVFMTYLETACMNRQWLEAEAVLLFEPGNLMF